MSYAIHTCIAVLLLYVIEEQISVDVQVHFLCV